MNREEAHKLLGGYATNSLTEEERRILFEAALDDQELFNALNDEQALKELLDDPFSREQMRRAAEQAPRRSWLRKPWVWATASVVVLSALTITAIRQQQLASKPQTETAMAVSVEKPAEALGPPQPAPEKKQLRTEPPRPVPRRREAVVDAAPAAKQPIPEVQAVAPPVPTAPPQETAANQVAQAQQQPPPPQEQQAQRADAIRQQVAAAPSAGFTPKSAPAPAVAAFRDTEKAPRVGGFAGMPALKKDLGASYFLSRRDAGGAFLRVTPQTVFRAGDVVRLTVIPANTGRLSVEARTGAAGEWKLIFPPTGEAVDVLPGRLFPVPLDLEVTPGLNVRVVIAPAGGGPPAITGVVLRVAP